MAPKSSTVQVQIDKHTEKIEIIEKRVEGLATRQVKTEIDVSELKKGLNLMDGNVQILVGNDKKIAEGLKKIDKKIPEPWLNKIKPWGWFVLFVLALGLIGGLLD